MSRSDELPPDQRAALSLLLRQRKTHAEVASMLKISEAAVHDRAHAALIMLAPREARGVSADKREEIGEYLLGQQAGVADRLRVRTGLSNSEPARAWASAVAKELEPIAGENLPEIPAAAPAAAAVPSEAARVGPPGAAGPVPVAAAAGVDGPPWEPAGRTLPSSRLGGGLLLAILLAAIVVTVILVTNQDSSKHHKGKSTAAAKTGGPKEEARFTLKPPEADSSSTGLVEILSESGKKALFVQAEHIPATEGFFYAIWLYNSHSSAQAVSRSPEVGETHSFSGAVALPGNASEFKEILITKETDTKPTRPGHVVLRGPFSVSQ